MPVTPSLKALVTLAEMAAFTGRQLGNLDDTQRDNLQRIINAVSLAMQRHCHTSLVTERATEFYDGGSGKIILQRRQVDPATVEVVEDGTLLTPAEDGRSVTAAGGTPDYWLDPDAGMIERNGIWRRGRRVVKVTYTAGWSVQFSDAATVRNSPDQALHHIDCPEDLGEACLIICKAHTDLGPGAFGVQYVESAKIWLRPESWPRKALDLLDPYRAG